MTINEEISKFTHDVEDMFKEVKQHMIVSVRDFSIQIAFVLMGITTTILIIGTIYVRCFHHPKHTGDNHSKGGNHVNEDNQKKGGNLKKGDNQKNGDKKGGKTKEKDEDAIVESKMVEDLEEKILKVDSEPIEQNGQLRKRTTSSSTSPSANVNNNNSPVKSKIPVRQRSVTKSP